MEKSNKLFYIFISIILFLIFMAFVFLSKKDEKIFLRLSDNNATIEVDDSYKIEVINTTSNFKYDLIYESSNPIVAVVDDNGNVTGVSEGQATIIIKNSIDASALYFTANIINKSITLEGISLSKTNITLEFGASSKVDLIYKPANATNKQISWSSNNTKVATVKDGTIKAVGVGNTTITATSIDGNYKATVKVIVNAKAVPVTGIAITDKTLDLTVGMSKKIAASVSPTNSTNKKIIWSSSNKNVAVVDEGQIKAMSAGTTTITATSEDGNHQISCIVKVSNLYRIHFIRQSIAADAILLESNGEYSMIDSGYYDEKSKNNVLNYLNSLGVKKLKMLFITHNHADHIGNAVTLINQFAVDKVYIKHYLGFDAKVVSVAQSLYDNTIKAAGNKVIFVDALTEGYTIPFNGMTINLYNVAQQMNKKEFKNTVSENVNSVTQLITVNGKKIYLAADSINSSINSAISKKVGSVDIFKISHHGYSDCGIGSTTGKTLKPKYTVVTNTQARLAETSNGVGKVGQYTTKEIIYFDNFTTAMVFDLSGSEIIKIRR